VSKVNDDFDTDVSYWKSKWASTLRELEETRIKLAAYQDEVCKLRYELNYYKPDRQ
jgi:hypothetical protein